MRQRRSTLFIVLFLGFVSIASSVSTEALRTHVTWLSEMARGGRRSGSAGASEAAQYISKQFEQLGFKVQMQDFGNNRRNVVAQWGTSEKYIVIGAHYDGQGAGMPSASDNAAGVAVLLEVVRDLKSATLPVSIVAVAFDDEEQGMNGSRYFVDHPLYSLDNAVAAIVLDAMGRSFIDLREWTMFVLGTEYSRELAEVIQKRSRPDMLVAGTDLIGPRSDFAPFAVKRIPYLFLSHGTHKDYHGAGDTADKIDYARLAGDATLIGQLVRDVAALKIRPAYSSEPEYPAQEVSTLLKLVNSVEDEKKDLPLAYRLILSDLKTRIQTDHSRETLRIASSALLAVATPRLSSFMLNLILGPFYENEKKPEIVAAIAEEAKRWQ